MTLTIEQANKLTQILDTELSKFGINYLRTASFRDDSKKSMPTMDEMRKPEFKVLQGHNRHECLLRIFESTLFTKSGFWSREQIKADGIDWNNMHCVPPLSDEQVEGQWVDSVDYYEKHKNDNVGADYEEKRREIEEKELSLVQLTEQDYKHLFDTIRAEAKHDVKATRQLHYGFLSKDTKTPFVMGVNAPSGSGKNYDIDLVADLFPPQDIIRVAGLSDKALFHTQGLRVIKDQETGTYQPLEPKVLALDRQIEDLKQEIEDLSYDKE